MGTQTKRQSRVRGIRIESWKREAVGVNWELIRRSKGHDAKRVKNTK